MSTIITASIASAGVGGIVTQLARLGIRARTQWNALRRQAAAPCGQCGQSGRGCGGGACEEWM